MYRTELRKQVLPRLAREEIPGERDLVESEDRSPFIILHLYTAYAIHSCPTELI